MINKYLPYGNFIKFERQHFSIMINGKYFAIFKGCNTNKWQYSSWINIWRKYKVPLNSTHHAMYMPNRVFCFFAEDAIK